MYLEPRGNSTESLALIFLKYWCPGIITGLVGGIIVAWVTPHFQTQFAQASANHLRSIQLWESVGSNFTQYIMARASLNAIARFENAGQQIDEETQKRKEEYRVLRDRARMSLGYDLLKARLYFTGEVRERIDQYVSWHNQYREKTVEELPSDAEYELRRDQILAAIGKHIGLEQME